MSWPPSGRQFAGLGRDEHQAGEGQQQEVGIGRLVQVGTEQRAADTGETEDDAGAEADTLTSSNVPLGVSSPYLTDRNLRYPVGYVQASEFARAATGRRGRVVVPMSSRCS